MENNNAIIKYTYSLPVCGLLASSGVTIIEISKRMPWGLDVLLWNLLPLIFMMAVFVVLRSYLRRKKRDTQYPYKIQLICALLLFVVLNIAYYKFTA